jgi:hypothetical protein
MKLTSTAAIAALVAVSSAPGPLTAPATDGQRFERAIVTAGHGPQRLAVDAALMAGAAPFTVVRRGGIEGWYVAVDGLSDVRLFDAEGREVPYLLVYSLRMTPRGESSVVPLRVEKRPSEPRHSRYHLQFAGAHLPIVALQIEVAGEYVFRPASVTEPRFAVWNAEPALLGHATLVRDEGPSGALRLPIHQPSQSELDLEIDDGNNPPLEVRSISAVLAERPWIYFDARPLDAARGGSVVARYGNGALTAPRYDLEAARGAIDIDRVQEARWEGPPRERAPAAELSSASVPLAGASIDTRPFRYSRSIAAGPAGLAGVPLDAAALAHSDGPQNRFADVRIVDAADRQVPYLVEQRAAPLTLDLRAEPIAPGGRLVPSTPDSVVSAYRIRLPEPALPDPTVVLSTSARVFHRRVQLGVEQPADRRHRDPWFQVLASRDWQHTDPSAAAPELILPLGLPAPVDLTLTVDEGVNGVLPIGGARLLLPSYRLRFYRPADTPLRLMYGREDLAVPQYDLALLASRVLSAPVDDVTVSPEPAASSAPPRPLVPVRAFWVLLAVAVIVLLAILARLLRQPEPDRS